MMNCQSFHDQVFEYLDGSLSASAQSAAESHLEQCAACRQAVRAHQELSARFRRETDGLLLRPEVKRRIEEALTDTAAAPAMEQPLLGFWRRFAWPAAIAAAVFVAAGLSLRRPLPPRPQPSKDESVSIRFSSCEPTYTFRRRNNLVMDALTCTPRVEEENISLSLNQKLIPSTQERKTTL
jgi:anti-sigma factor RsiW